MESNGDRDTVREQLREVERGEVVSWVVCPPTPFWWPVVFGVWAATLVLVVDLLDGAVQSVLTVALLLPMFGLIAWDRRRRGTYPNGLPPHDFRGVVLRMLLGAAVVAGVAWLVDVHVSVWVAAAVAGVGSWAVVARYEHEYAGIAARVRERLG